MGRGKEESWKNHFFNSWCEEFSAPRRVNDEKIRADGGKLFFDPGDTTARLEVQVLKNFCRGTSFEDVEKAKDSAGCQKVLWIDDRNNFADQEGSGEIRSHENPLTATGALRILEQRRFNHEEKLPDAARRLIYVSDLSPACIRALAATASSLQVPTLRNAIYKHLAFQPSIAVTIRSKGYLTFQLELHLPFFILEKSLPPNKTHDKSNKKPDRGWTDLSFLKLDTSNLAVVDRNVTALEFVAKDKATWPRTRGRFEAAESSPASSKMQKRDNNAGVTTADSNTQSPDKNEVWSLQEAQISCVVTGTDDWQWIAYGFVDSEVDGDLDDSEIDDELDDSEVDGDLDDPDSWTGFDQIAAGEIEAKFPIWKPRDYWVKILEIRIGTVRVEYEYLIRTLESAVKQYMTDHPSTLSRQLNTTQDPTAEIKEAFDWALKMKDLLRQPHDVLLATLNAWREFISDDGDIEYFKEHSATKETISRYRSIRNIKQTFRQLEACYNAIVALSKKCSDYQDGLKLRLTLDKKAAADKNEFISVLSLMFFYPVALAAAIFSMQPGAIPFKQSPRAFALTVFILIFIIYVTQLLGTHVLPWLQKRVVQWIGKALSKDTSKTGEENFADPEKQV